MADVICYNVKKGEIDMGGRRKIFELFEKHADYVNEKVSYGIEHYRKGNASIKVTTAAVVEHMVDVNLRPSLS